MLYILGHNGYVYIHDLLYHHEHERTSKSKSKSITAGSTAGSTTGVMVSGVNYNSYYIYRMYGGLMEVERVNMHDNLSLTHIDTIKVWDSGIVDGDSVVSVWEK